MLFDDGFESILFNHGFSSQGFTDFGFGGTNQPFDHVGLLNGHPAAHSQSAESGIAPFAPLASFDVHQWLVLHGLGFEHVQDIHHRAGSGRSLWFVDDLGIEAVHEVVGKAPKDARLDTETIVVVGDLPDDPPPTPRPTYVESVGGDQVYVHETADADQDTSEPDDPCVCDGMSEAEKLEQAIDAEVARIRAEILERDNQNMEYGSIIYRDAAGNLRHTPLVPSSDYHARFDMSGMPRNADGTTDFSGIVAIVHSHPEYNVHPQTGQIVPYYDSRQPDRLLTPTSSADWSGTQSDWQTYDNYASSIRGDGGNTASLRFYIIGFGGESRGLVINQYGWEDRETETVSDGEHVEADTQACTC